MKNWTLKINIFSWFILLAGACAVLGSISPVNVTLIISGFLTIFCGIGLLQRRDSVRKFVVFVSIWQFIISLVLIFFVVGAATLNLWKVQSGWIFDYMMKHPSNWTPFTVILNSLFWLSLFVFLRTKYVRNEFVNEKIEERQDVVTSNVENPKNKLFITILGAFFIGILLSVLGVVFYNHWQRTSLDSQTQNDQQTGSGQIIQAKDPEPSNTQLITQQETFKDSKQFLQATFDAMETYRLGNNKFLEGSKATKYDGMNLKLGQDVYEAKGYFEKMIDEANDIKNINSTTSAIKKALIKAASTRIESVDLFTQGYLIKAQEGQAIKAAIVLQTKQKIDLPTYNGQIEEGLAKIKIANAYFIDALRLLKAYSGQIPADGTLSYPDFDFNLNYYSDKPNVQ